jgi:hypothetical protein
MTGKDTYVPKLVETRHETKLTILWIQQGECYRTIRNIMQNDDRCEEK